MLNTILSVGAGVLLLQLVVGLFIVSYNRNWSKFVLSPIAIATCDITGCSRSPRFDIGGGKYVCRSHL